MLKTSAIMDFVSAAVYLVISVVIIYFGITMFNFDPNQTGAEGAEVMGAVIGGVFVILLGIIFVIIGVASLIFFIAAVAYGGSTLSATKLPIDKLAKRMRAVKVGYVFGYIFSVGFIIAAIVSAVGGSYATIAFFLVLAGVTLATSIINMKTCREVDIEWKKELE
ncbi:MAG: hypothetical protein IJ226_04650, partial [Clostridia bacterium]|nr:hypothetical protein [Clostridia bacterium]